MKTNVRDSSIVNHYENVKRGFLQPEQEKIMAALREFDGWTTRRVIALKMGMQTSSVSARVNALVACGRIEETAENIQCPDSGRMVTGIRAVSA